MLNNVCPICGSREIIIFIKNIADITFKTTTEKFNIFCCKNCDAKFQNPFIPENEVGQYYPNASYHPFMLQKKAIPLNLKYNPASIYIRKLMEKHNCNDIFSLIDVGCGGGTFLMSVKQYFPNAQLMGVDVSEIAIKNLNKIGIDGICSSLYSFEINRKFDYIISSQVLEHLNQPYLFTKKLKDLSKPESIIMIDVPASDSYSAEKFKENWVHWDLPRHSIIYSKKTIDYLFKDFTKIELRHAGSLAAVLSSYKISKGKDIYFQTLYEKMILKLVTPITKLFKLHFLFSDKLVWIGKL
ncbi:MAG: class I SAM-dependent methyltransferase [Bacteroidota bacterium]